MRIALFAATGYGNALPAQARTSGHEVAIVFAAARDESFERLNGLEPLASAARAAGAHVCEDVDALRNAVAFEALRAAAPDLLLVVNGYDRTVGLHVASVARCALYLHPSLLPRFRGPSPSNWALIEGARETGVTLATLTRRNDAGPVVAQRRVPIDPAETDGSLRPKLARAMCALFAEHARAQLSGDCASAAQDEAANTSYPAIHRRDAHIRFDQSRAGIVDRVRAVTPYPGAYTDVDGREFAISAVADAGSGRGVEPGRIAAVDAARSGLTIVAGDGLLRVTVAADSGGLAEFAGSAAHYAGRQTPFSLARSDARAGYDLTAPTAEQLGRFAEFPDMVVVAVAYPCNALCPNCPYTPGNSTIREKYADAQFIAPQLFMKIADECGEAGRRGWVADGALIRITGGGEPMLHPYGLTRLIEYGKAAGARVYLNTNGSRFTRADSERLLACAVDNIEISVDAADAPTYAIVRKGLDWERLLTSLRHLIDRRNATGSSTTIEVSVINQKLVAGRTAQIEAFWRNFGVDNVLQRKFLTWGSATDIDPGESADPLPYLDREAGVACPYPFERINIDARGKAEVCGFDIGGRTNLGNLADRTIREIWTGPILGAWREKHAQGRGGEIPLCAECPDWKYRSWQHNYRKALVRAGRQRDEARR